MNRVAVRRAIYFPMLAVLLFVAGLAVFLLRAQPLLLLLIAGVVFAPGLVARILLKELFASRDLLARREFERSLAAAQRFLGACAKRPWIRHAIWGAFGVYSLDVVAMAENNAGAALIELTRFDEAKRFLLAARQRDEAYPIPVFNPAILEKLRGNEDGADAHAEVAYRLGLRANGLDALRQSIGEAYARVSAGSD